MHCALPVISFRAEGGTHFMLPPLLLLLLLLSRSNRCVCRMPTTPTTPATPTTLSAAVWIHA